MAISGNFFGLRSGSTHSLTFQPRMMTLNEMRDRCAYAQMTADRFQGTKNENPSDAQLKQWAIFANISHAKSLLRGKLAGCFGCASSKEAEKKFWQENKDGEQIIGAYPKQFLYSPIANYRFGDDESPDIVFRNISYNGFYVLIDYKYNRNYNTLSSLLANSCKIIMLNKVGPRTAVTINNANFTVRATTLEVYKLDVSSIIRACLNGNTESDRYLFTYMNDNEDFELLNIVFKNSLPLVSIVRSKKSNNLRLSCQSGTIGFCLLPTNRNTGLYHGSWIRCMTEVIDNEYITLEQAAESWRPNASFSYRYLDGGDEGFDVTQLPFPN